MDANCDYYWPNPNDSTNRYECTDQTFTPTHLISLTGEIFGENSRCFDVSTLRVSGNNPSHVTRCHKAECNAAGTEITVTVGTSTV